MTGREYQRRHTEAQLISGRLGFSGSYMAVKYLRTHVDDHPCQTTRDTVKALTAVIRSPRFDAKKQVFFLFSEAADAMVALAISLDKEKTAGIIERLCAILSSAAGPRVRAVGNALGRLPVSFSAVVPGPPKAEPPLELDLSRILAAFLSRPAGPPAWQGRSLLFPLENNGIGVIKFANSKANTAELGHETFWLAYLNRQKAWEEDQSHLPTPVTVRGRTLFRTTIPPGGPLLSGNGACIAFSTCQGYFDYPNEDAARRPRDQAQTIFYKNAKALGRLTAMGIFHTALIPLFHNRIQQGRRNDNGAYLWEHGGRLDQWLASCRYPNFASSGLRDFEHLVRAKTSTDLRHIIGEHLLSFILVMGSYFRNKAPERKGWNASGIPEDTKDLFCAAGFETMIQGVCRTYFKSLTRRDMPGRISRKLPGLTRELIRAMGEDRDMVEILRVQDQNGMDEDRYRQFLARRGMAEPMPPKGESEITLMTGPHLGGFNQAISVPGLIDFLFNFSSLCVTYCFARANRLKAFKN